MWNWIQPVFHPDERGNSSNDNRKKRYKVQTLSKLSRAHDEIPLCVFCLHSESGSELWVCPNSHCETDFSFFFYDSPKKKKKYIKHTKKLRNSAHMWWFERNCSRNSCRWRFHCCTIRSSILFLFSVAEVTVIEIAIASLSQAQSKRSRRSCCWEVLNICRLSDTSKGARALDWCLHERQREIFEIFCSLNVSQASQQQPCKQERVATISKFPLLPATLPLSLFICSHFWFMWYF